MDHEGLPNKEFYQVADQLEASYGGVVAQIRAKFNDLAVVMDKTFYLFTAALMQPKIVKNTDSQDVFHFLMGRGMKTFRSITTLLLEGYEQDAFALLRGLVEVTIASKYIAAKDTPARAARFRDYQTIEAYRFMNGIRTIDPDLCAKTFPKHEIDRLEQSLAEYLKKYGGKYNDNLSWAGMSYFKMASLPEVSMVDEFIKGYSVYSMFTHASFQAMEDYSQIVNGKRVVALGPSHKRAEHCGFLAVGYLIQLIQCYVDTLGIDGLTWLLTEVRVNLSARGPTVGHTPKVGVKIEKGTWGRLPAWKDIKTE